jgi:hypothetical protein
MHDVIRILINFDNLLRMIDGIIENLHFPYNFRPTGSSMASFMIFENYNLLSDSYFIFPIYRLNRIRTIYYDFKTHICIHTCLQLFSLKS